MKACLYCGCTSKRACVVDVSEQPAHIRIQLERYYESRGGRMPKQTGCSWISNTPPVCSAPACMTKHAEAWA